MFGLKKMRRQRDALYAQTEYLEANAARSRQRFTQATMNLAASPEGIATSFILGLTTQCELANRHRETLLKAASSELINTAKDWYLASLSEQRVNDKTS